MNVWIRILLVVCILPSVNTLEAQTFTTREITGWKQQAGRVTITRDTWGIPHINGKSDADAVFGLLYAQCEDDFFRVERNYLMATARMSEAFGEEYLFHDLRMRLFIDTTTAIRLYNQADPWLKNLCDAFAGGINYYLYKHPEVKPKAIRRFQPWMPFMFSEGSIGTDIESVSINGLKDFYQTTQGREPELVPDDGNDRNLPGDVEPRGSNGFAIAPPLTRSGKAILLINPHTTFYFRSEVQLTSREGLNAYGAVTWGQFFIYQGFNEHCGWMHTSSYADTMDEYLETITKSGNTITYLYNKEQRPVITKTISIKVKSGPRFEIKSFTGYYTHHGPVIAKTDSHWITLRLMNEPTKALTQSFTRIKARGYQEFKKTMELRTNSSNNTVYADKDGNIAYWHGNFIPRRNPTFNWNLPVDGSNPETEWKGLHELNEIISLYNPATNWIQNCNSTPFTASLKHSPDPKNYPAYMATEPENPRGLHAVEVLTNQTDFTLEKLVGLAYDSHLPAFDQLAPSLAVAFDQVTAVTDSFQYLHDKIDLIRNWDRRFSATSVETTLAIYWAQQLRKDKGSAAPDGSDQLAVIHYLNLNTTPIEKVQAFATVIRELTHDFGTWKVQWGDVNRFQRLSNSIEPVFDDSKESLAIPFTSAFWGSLASFGARRYSNTKKMYGNVGNSFVAAVEFGPRVKAISVMAGGSVGSPDSPHFKDQATLYQAGKFKKVLFYPEDLKQNTERVYRPGE